MKIEMLEALVRSRCQEIMDRTKRKNKEYSRGEDVLSNIKTTALLCKLTPLEVCFNFMSKHIISIRDMAQDHKPHPDAAWAEKLGDIIVYCLLMEACAGEGHNADKID